MLGCCSIEANASQIGIPESTFETIHKQSQSILKLIK